MYRVVIDTNVYKQLMKEDNRVVKAFFMEIFHESLTTKTILHEYLDSSSIKNKLDKDMNDNHRTATEINTIIEENTKKYEDIWNMLKLISKSTDSDELKKFRNKRIEFNRIRKKFIEEIKTKRYYNKELLYDFILELEKVIEDIKGSAEEYILGEISTANKRYCENVSKLINKVEFLRNEERLILNYLSIVEYTNCCEKTNELKQDEIQNIKEFCNNTNQQYYGSGDSNKDESKRYNDQIIWNEIKKYSKDNKCDIIFVTDDFKEIGKDNLKEKIINEFKSELNTNINIVRLKEYEVFVNIENKLKPLIEFDKYKETIINEFLKNKEFEDIINEVLDYMDTNEIKCIEQILESDFDFEEDEYRILEELKDDIEDVTTWEHEYIDFQCNCELLEYGKAIFLTLKKDILTDLAISIKYRLEISEKKFEFNIDDVNIEEVGKTYDCFVVPENSYILKKFYIYMKYYAKQNSLNKNFIDTDII